MNESASTSTEAAGVGETKASINKMHYMSLCCRAFFEVYFQSRGGYLGYCLTLGLRRMAGDTPHDHVLIGHLRMWYPFTVHSIVLHSAVSHSAVYFIQTEIPNSKSR